MKFILLHKIDTQNSTSDCVKILEPIILNTSTIDSIGIDYLYPLTERAIESPGYIKLPYINQDNHLFCSLIKRLKLNGETENITVYESVAQINSKLNYKLNSKPSDK